MSREILYKKTTEKESDLTNEKSKTNNATEQGLVEWIRSHELLNISALCKQAGINRSNFDKSLRMGLISPKHEPILIKILKNYGYGK
jgi:hypothetical protein